MRHLYLIPVAAALLIAAPGRSWAQSSPTRMGQPTGIPGKAKATGDVAPENRPAALPGAAQPDQAAPPTRPSAEMEPNAALFDSINRGDLPAAKEALSRGADIDARNVLGMTPVDLSVDLSRNDITFLLLSMRTTGAGSAPVINPNGKGKNSTANLLAAQPKPKPVPKAVAAREPTPTTVRRQYVGNDPGTPVPQDGFLGFGTVTR